VKSRLGAVAAAVVVLVLAAACSSSDNSATTTPTTTAAAGEDNAATVNGVGIKRADFDADLQDYVHNSLFVATGEVGDEAATSGTASVDFVRKTLQADILFELVRQEVDRRHLMLRPLNDAVVRTQTIARFDESGSPDIFDAFSKRFQDRALSQTANLVALQDALGGGPVDAAKVRATYDADPQRFGRICVRQIQLLSEDDAKRVMTDLEKGADFTTTLTKETEDRTSEPYGGRILNPDGSCPTAVQLDADFATAALAATPGRPTGPVKTKMGWHIILVDEVKVLPFEQVESIVAAKAEEDVATKAGPQINQLLQTGVTGAIHVDAKYGVWDPVNHQVLPPGFRPTPAPPTTVPVTTTG
jgi:parvulin-like peptidyl-prolyl isomerase